jgi:hypothetical protein
MMKSSKLLLTQIFSLFSLTAAHAQTQLPFATEKNGVSLATPSIVFSIDKNGELIVGGKPFKLNNSIQLKADCKKSFCLSVSFNKESTWIFKKPELLLVNSQNESIDFDSDQKDNEYEITSKQTKSGLVRACLSEFKPANEALLCTSFLNLETGAQQESPVQIVINNAKSPLSGSVGVKWNESFQLAAQANNGSLMARTLVPQPTLHQAFEIEDGDIQVTFYGANSSAIVPKNLDRGVFWQHTIGDLRNYQTDIIKKQDPYIHFESELGLLFSSALTFKQLPLASEIINLKAEQPLTTYRKELALQVDIPEDYSATSTETSFEPETQTWLAATPEAYSLNSPTLTVNRPNGKSQYFIQPEIYRAYSTYVAARVGLSVASDSSFATLGDFSFWHWFEKPFGSSPTFSHLRWGASATVVQSATTSLPNSKYQVITANGIYRFNQGTTERTEALAVTFGASSLKFLDEPSVTFMGAGILWSRSLPNWFNSIVGWTEFLRRPKWTDFEVLYYPVSLKSSVKGSIAQVRATARIEVSKSVYFDAGWGILVSTYTDSIEEKQGDLSISRGYFGLGYRF